MKIMFLNVCDGMAGSGLDKFLNNYKKEVNIFCLQETFTNLQNKFDEGFHNFTKFYVEKEANDGAGKFLTTYVVENSRSTSQIILDDNEINIGVGIKTRVDGLIVDNIHGAPLPGNKKDNKYRLKQSKMILETLINVPGKKIIGGDFNLDLETESVKLFENAGYRNLIREYRIKTTRNNISWAQYPKEEHQLFADFVFVSPEVKVKNFEVIDNEVSDHLPMILEIDD